MILAYIDPGLGGVMLQLLLASMVGVVYRFRNAVLRAFQALRGRKPDDPQ